MIGQKEVIKQINNLIEKGFPRFVIITGSKGQGKTKLADYIANKLNYKIIDIEPKVDSIREMIVLAYKQTTPIIYLIQNADKMSLNAKNSLLKVIEEPPNNAYFIMELQQIENTLETIKSRCQEIKMDDYNEFDINKLIDLVNPDMTSQDKSVVIDIASNYYEISLLNKYNPLKFYKWVEKVFNNIYKVQSANSFKITDNLDLKDDGKGYDLNLFFKTYERICMDNLLVDSTTNLAEYTASIDITSKYQQKLKINGINKQMLIDNWILDIRKVWRDGNK